MKRIITVFVLFALVLCLAPCVGAGGASREEIDEAFDSLFCSDYELTNEDLNRFMKMTNVGGLTATWVI